MQPETPEIPSRQEDVVPKTGGGKGTLGRRTASASTQKQEASLVCAGGRGLLERGLASEAGA